MRIFPKIYKAEAIKAAMKSSIIINLPKQLKKREWIKLHDYIKDYLCNGNMLDINSD